MSAPQIEQFGEVLFAFPVLRHEWEMDGRGYVVRAPDGETMLVLTNHGEPYVAETEELETLIVSYRQSLNDARQALMLLNGNQEDDWWSNPASEICQFYIPAGNGSHVLTLHGRQGGDGWEYAIVQWWHKSPSVWLSWHGSEILSASRDLSVQLSSAQK